MAQQNSVDQYMTSIQSVLSGLVNVPVLNNFDRQFANSERFITWQLRDVHQPVYTGIYQANKGIDTPVFQISIFTTTIDAGLALADQIMQGLHGYTGTFGSIYVSKADVHMLFQGYDDEIKLYNIYMDCFLYIPA